MKLFDKRIGGSRAALKAVPAAILAWAGTWGMASAAVYAPDNFAVGGGTNLETMVMVKDGTGRVLVGGLFNTVEGNPGYQGVARYNTNTDDSLDLSFKVKTDEFVKAIAVQPDGKILIGGQFHWVTPAGSSTATQIWGIARLKADGTLDNTFQNAPAGKVKSNHNVRGIAVQPDGKIIIGGYFTAIDGVARNYIARLTADGVLDTTFTPSVNNRIEDVKLDADGKILISGSFTQVQGQSRWGVARLNSDGTLDTTFDAGNPAGAQNGAWAGLFPVYQLAVQADGKILYAGGTLRYASEVHRGVARVNTDGTPDSSFKSSINDWGTSIALQTVGGEQKIVVGGSFTVAGERNTANDTVIGTDMARRGVARFNADGSLDTDFDTSNGTDTKVWAVLPNDNGTVYLGGTFNLVAGTVRHGVARLAPLDPTKQIIPFVAPQPGVYSAASGAAFAWNPAPPTQSSAGLPVTYTSLDTSVCTVNATTGVVALATSPIAGTCTIKAEAAAGTVDGVEVQAATPVEQSMRITLLKTQAITFPEQADHDVAAGPFAISPAAQTDSGLAVTYTSLTPDVCTVSASGTVTPKQAGACRIAANQPGNVEFDRAEQVVGNITLTGAAAPAPTVLAPVPTLETWALGLLAALLGVMGFRRRGAQ